MRGTIVCLCLLLLTPALLSAGEPVPVPQPALTVDKAPAACPVSQTPEAKSQSTSDNWCGAPCSPNGAWDECIGYNPCGWLQIDSCRCAQGTWRCLWTC